MNDSLLEWEPKRPPLAQKLPLAAGTWQVNIGGVNVTYTLTQYVGYAYGSITANGTGIATGTTPSAMILTPSGDAAFVANRDSNDISRYTIKSDNTLVAVSGNTPTGVTPVSMAIDSAGHFLFVANRGSDDISVFSISSGAGLTEIAGSRFPAASSPF